MADITTNKIRSVGSTSSQSQQSKVMSSVFSESLESKLTLKDLEELMTAFMVSGIELESCAVCKISY